MKCNRTGCNREATNALGVEFYPHEALMVYYNSREYITRIVIGLDVCEECTKITVIKDLFPGNRLLELVKTIEDSSSITVDMNNLKIVPVSFEDPEYIYLIMNNAEDEDVTDTKNN